MKIIILIGAPGSGKGTQASIITKKLSIPQLSTGDILRRTVSDESSECGREIKSYMDGGKLVPDELVIRAIEERMLESDCKDGFILDGFPRNIQQAQRLKEFFTKHQIFAKADIRVMELKVDNNIIAERISGRFSCKDCGAGYHDKFKKTAIEGICDVCGSKEFVRRKDDTVELVKVRLETYDNETRPTVRFYKQLEELIVIDGMQEMDVVSNEIASNF
jgi:adenylate kinase